MKASVRRVLGMFLGVTIVMGSIGLSTPYLVKGATAGSVQFRTQEEIANYYNTHYFSIRSRTILDQDPDVSQDVSGAVNDSSKQEALNAVNLMRFIAGLNEVGLNEQYHNLSQHGAVLLDTAGILSHNPSKPNGMSDAFYQKGYKGSSESNLALGYQGLPHAVITGWMDDTDPRSVTELGHRRWMLDPDMRTTGFGQAGRYSQMYAFDGYSQSGFSVDYIPWPATNTPSQFFSGNWSVSLNPRLYGPSNDVTVHIQDKATGRTVRYSDNDRDDFLYSYQNGGKYGRSNAVIFEPSLNTDVGKSYNVRISGLKNRSGGAVADIVYDVNFFNIEQVGNNSSIRVPENSRNYEYTPSEWEEIQGNMLPLATSSNSNRPRRNHILTDNGNSRDNHSSGGGSGGFGSSGGSGRRVRQGANGFVPNLQSDNLNITPEGEWVSDGTGRWGFLSKNGHFLRDTWAKLHNPYSKNDKAKWFRFDEIERLQTGWHTSADGHTYYLNPNSDGSKGEMLTGWQWIEKDGINKCYYFSEEQNSLEGHLLKSTSVNGWTVNEHGEWTQNNQVVTKEMWDAMKNSQVSNSQAATQTSVTQTEGSSVADSTLHANTEEARVSSMTASNGHVKIGPTVPRTLSPETEAGTEATSESNATVSRGHIKVGPTVPHTLSPETEASTENTGENNLSASGEEAILSSKPVTSGVKRYISRK